MTEEEKEMHRTIFFGNNLLYDYAMLRAENANNISSPLILQKFLSVISLDQAYYFENNIKSTLIYHHQHDLYIKCFKELLSSLHSLNKYNFFLASKLFVEEGYKVQDDFQSIANDFKYGIESVDFSKKEDLTEHINAHIEDKIRNVVQDLLPNNNLDVDTRLGLVDLAYFKGKWDKPFELEPNTRTFYLSENDSVETQMLKMTGEVYYKYNEFRSTTTIELPLISEEYSIILCMAGREYIKEFATNLSYYSPQDAEDMTLETVEVVLPKFKIETFLDCKKMFADMHLAQEFNDNVYLFDVLQSDEFLKYGQIDEKGIISIDEEGVEATSGLAVTMVPVDLDKKVVSPDGLNMSEMTVKTTISNRFAKTLITCKIRNNNDFPQETNFSGVLPETAFITEFIMEIDGKSYKSYIKPVEEAKAIYKEAVSHGKSAGIVEADTRDSTQFNATVNLEPQSEAVFLLTYEEMLQRTHDQYELVLNISPGRIVDNLNVEVTINESRPLKFVKTPPLRSGKEMNKKIESYVVPSSEIIALYPNSSVVKFSADVIQQQKIGYYLGSPTSGGFSGQFVVQYDIERDPKDGEILLQDGYFVHFFAPNDLDPLPKHIVFVLDTSSSMMGRKLDQLKDAMMSILSEVREGDLISLLEFNEHIIVWNVKSETSTTISCNQFNDFYKEPFGELNKFELPTPILVDGDTISKAKNIVRKMPADGSTFMIGSLEVALYLIKVGKQMYGKKSEHQPIMVFLTDGQPNVGCGFPPEIMATVTKLNSKHDRVPIFSLSFGNGADKAFLRELSLRNFGFSRHIYEASDASLQLQSFYKQISSPLLTDIKFKYESDVTELTRTHFPIYFKGGELVVSGRYGGCQLPNTINGCGLRGYLNLGSIIENPVTSLERLWAYLTVKQLLDERSLADDKEELTKRAVDLAMMYCFVTEVTSLVVVKPDEICYTSAPPIEETQMEMACRTKKRIIKRCLKKRKNDAWKEELHEIVTADEDLEVDEEPQPEPEPEGPKKLEFVADHPFLMAVMLKRGDRKIILFVGEVHKPS